ncbi:MAG: PfkB family carbohydrate kinase [Bryobacterales bacterium]|nr:PfkB family carbohydrate kinase [Bryobacterales bacterium]
MTPEGVLDAAVGIRVLVVGDICLDRWCWYDPELSEPSRETGIPRRAVVASKCTPGAGGTVASNLCALGVGQVTVLGTVGTGGAGHDLQAALACRGIDAGQLIADRRVVTFTYTKLINAASGQEDEPRVDFVNTTALPESLQRRLIDRFSALVESYDAVIVADQAETPEGGSITSEVRDEICRAAGSHRATKFLGDSRSRVELFRNCTMTPNEEEAAAGSQRAFGDVDYGRLQGLIGGPVLVVTAGSRGAWLVEGGVSHLLPPAPAKQVVDVCGAGDSLTAGMALALAAGAGPDAALQFGMLVASVTVGKRGTGTADSSEVLAAAETADWGGQA